MTSPDLIDARLLGLLACPRDHGELRVENGRLCCDHGHSYPIVDGVPVFLLAEREQTIGIASASLQAAETASGAPLYVATIGLTDEQRRAIERDWSPSAKIDSVISYLIGATSGWGYVDLVGSLQNYPIPDIPVGHGSGQLLLDIGSNWGRWSVSAARKGWRVVGIEPSLGAIMAARRAFSGLGLDIAFVCGDARFLPFKPDVFGCAFSYSVLQHFSEADAEMAIAEAGRVLRRGGVAKIQMANRGGLRSTYVRTRPNYLEGGSFRVRYWGLTAMRQVFERHIGRTGLRAEAFGGLGLLAEDRDLVSAKAKMLIASSTLLKRFSTAVPALINFADSVYVTSIKP
jgi:SAM-dependent methyltransferase/uncharacterized protein YbaR (Trm112 family)